MDKIKRISFFFRILFQIIFLTLPALLVVTWYYAPEPLMLFFGTIRLNALPATYTALHVYSENGVPENVILHTLTVTEKIIAFALSTIPLMIKLFILHALIQLFRLYEDGEIFSLNNVRYIRNIGYGLLIVQIVNPIYDFILGFVITWNNPPGHRFAAITVDQTNIGVLLTAILVILISWIMAEGCHLREEQQLTI